MDSIQAMGRNKALSPETASANGGGRAGVRRGTATIVLVILAAALAGTLAGCFSSEPDSSDLTGPDALARLCDSPVPPAEGSGPRVVTIINSFSFDPSIEVAPGTTITWMNCEDPVENAPGATDHTVTSDVSDGPLGSALLSPGETYSHTFTETGRFPYHCTPHPFMQAVVIVEEET